MTSRQYLSGERTPGFGPARHRTPSPATSNTVGCAWRPIRITALGYAGSYPSFTRAIRECALRPVCTTCKQNHSPGRAVIAHPPGAKTHWDWLELPDPPAGWGWGKTAYVLIGTLPHSSRWRG
ncbi:MAG TPA: hypothetical protein VMU34_24495, partial [Mycobacterium sp.]|nr:hypothetical protein [Mycobacterium sp.]